MVKEVLLGNEENGEQTKKRVSQQACNTRVQLQPDSHSTDSSISERARF